jgi:NarL family two-component system response regulator LiaR
LGTGADALVVRPVRCNVMQQSDKKIEIFIAEDNEIIRVGLRLTLSDVEDFKVVGEAEDGITTVEKVIALKPTIVLMDIGLPGLDGITATAQIKSQSPSTHVMILTSHDNDEDVFAAIRAGADAYLLKEVTSANLVSAVRAVANGVVWLDPGVAQRVLRASIANAPKAVNTAEAKNSKNYANATPLSQRELDVLTLVVEGNSNQEIADRLILSVETVKTHMRHIMEKLSVSDRTQAAVKAMREGLV